MKHIFLCVLLIVAGQFVALAQGSAPVPERDRKIRSAIEKAIPGLERGSSGSAEKRECFTCHNQAVPVFALSAAQHRGFAIDADNLKRQVAHTFAHLKRGEENYRQGKGQGGQSITAGYALWTLEAAEWKSDEVTSAVTHYLIVHQQDSDHWAKRDKRPPSAGSDFTTTYVALRGLSYYGTEAQMTEFAARKDKVTQWLKNAQPKETEDRVFHLSSLPYVDADVDVVQQAVNGLLKLQRPDGGWAQKADMQSDAYATATVLVALLEAGGLQADHPAISAGLDYLLTTQLDDGTWHVATRADGFQTYFESGFPHAEDQFISISATGWATLALTKMLPTVEVKE